MEKWYDALPVLQELDSLLPNDPEINYQLGRAYFNSVSKPLSLRYFLTAARGNYEAEDLDYYLGRAYHHNHRFDDAIAYYQKYDATLDLTDDIDRSRHNEVSRYLENCAFGKTMLPDSILLEIANAGPTINSVYPDYVPVVSADESMILFTSRRSNTTGGKINHDGQYFEDIYLSTRKKDGSWSQPEQLSKPINTKDHDACIGLSPDGTTLFVYKDSGGGDIFSSNISGNNVKKWSKPEKLKGEVNTDYWEGSASLSKDNKTLYFSSDQEGGYGGSDIYFSKRQPDGSWGKPTNLGPTINTPYDEGAPQIHSDEKTLFFSSRGHNGMGGYDIFSTVKDPATGQWSSPRNIGYPVNSANEDIYFSLTSDGAKGYFSSYRFDSYGEKDIYIMHRPLSSPTMFLFKGTVMNKASSEPISATITLTNKATNSIDTVVTSDILTGRYHFNMEFDTDYNLKVEADNFRFHTEDVNFPYQADLFEYIMTFAIEDDRMYVVELQGDTTQIAVNEKGSLFGDPTPVPDSEKDPVQVTPEDLERIKNGETIILRNVHFDFNKSTLKRESIKTLNQVYSFLAQNPQLYFEIAGHTDNIGSIAYNQRLSERRARAVYNYLTTKGIGQSNLTPRGHGELKPIATNNTPEGRRLNRRAEMKRISSEGDYIAHQGNQSNSDDGYLIWEQLSIRAHFVANKGNFITKYSQDRLNTLVAILKSNYPDSKVMIVGYDDNETEDPAKELDKERASTVYDYLVKQGISADNLIPRSYRDMSQFVGNNQEPPGVRRRKVEFYLLN
ncbi:MAG: cell envelope biogenesis protein OmpA [Cyclobacteriaceae bacterium]|nr:MAG: cell envelope biogenesis protein OmpA [Cyclobacteriaceae bacterium]